MKTVEIGVLLPSYNEAAALPSILRGIPSIIQQKGVSYKITPIVIDDGSSDNTRKVVLSVKGVVLIQHIINSGAGAATRTGISYLRNTNYEYGATMDADGQHSPADLEKVLRACLKGECDIVLGSRLKNTDGMPWYKVVGNRGLNFFTRILLGVSSSDSQSGLKAFNRKTIENLNYRENGYAFCSEMLWRAKKAQLTIKEVPIQAIYSEYSKSKGQSNWNAFQIIKQMVRHRIKEIS
ncbi:MAG: glycosyltransferase family 2 protein [bacterium]